MSTTTSREVDLRIIEGVRSGKSPKEVASDLGLSIRLVYARLAKMRFSAKTRDFTLNIKTLRHMVACGRSVKDISTKLGCPQQVVRNLCRLFELTRDPAIIPFRDPEELRTCEILKVIFHFPGIPDVAVASLTGCPMEHVQKIRAWMDEYKIKKGGSDGKTLSA